MNTMPALPPYSAEALGNLTVDALVEALVRDEDRAPRNLIDECVRRGESIVARLSGVVEGGRGWKKGSALGEWWLLLHAVMILGLIPSESAGLLLKRFMRRMALAEDENLQDWFSGNWPALFRNKPASAIDSVRRIAENGGFDWYIRANAVEVVIDAARCLGDKALERALDWLARLAADEREDWELRLATGNTLLDFPRARHRPLLDQLAARQSGLGRHFSPEDIREAYAAGRDRPGWERFSDPWRFYAPAAIEKRQRRWAEEAAAREKREQERQRSCDAVAAARAAVKIGRNDPCPCGSGRKYKHCCLNKQEEPSSDDLAWRRLRRALDGLPKAMMRTAREHFGPETIDEAWAAFNARDNGEPFDRENPYLQIFLPWYLYDWLPDPEKTAVPVSAQAETAAAAYLRREARRLDPFAKRYVEACMAAPFSFHEIIACDPGRSFRLRDVLLGAEVDAIEHEGSRNARAGDLIFAKAVRCDRLTLVEGFTPVLIPPIHKTRIIAFREQLAAQGAVFDARLLHEHGSELREIYLEIANQVLHPRMPQMSNTDGDPLEFRQLVFDINSAREAFDAPKGLAAEAPEDELLRDAKSDAAGVLVRAEINWRRTDSDTILGTLRIDGRRLTAEVNSARRAEELRGLIEERLGTGGRYRAGTVQSVASMLNREPTPSERAAARERAAESARLAALPEVQAAIAVRLRGHYRKWLDEKIPALGGRTPREAARDPAWREAVAALVLQIERDGPTTEPPLDPAIVHEMREALGL